MPADRASLAVLLFVALAVHAPFIRDGYITDDFVHLGLIAQGLTVNAIASEPDTFGYFRPVQQLSYWIEHHAFGQSAGMRYRVVNLLLHLAVIALGFRLAERILGSTRAALIASLAFVLSPKVNTIAVLWISARAEVLMALFSLAALLAWMRWVERGGFAWLACAAIGYALAVLSKETALLLPLLAIVLPLDRSEPRRRIAGGVALAAVGGAVYLARGWTGAITPSAEMLSGIASPATVWWPNFQRYLIRAMLGPAAVIAATLVAHKWKRRGAETAAGDAIGGAPPIAVLLVLAAIWFLIFILPALPVNGRSEIRVYVAGFGFCLLAGAIAHALERRYGLARRINAALVVCAVLLGGYQVTRALASDRDMAFSRAFIAAVREHDALGTHRGMVTVVPATPEIGQLLQNTVGGYLRRILRMEFGRTDIDASVGVSGVDATNSSALALTCDYVRAQVHLIQVNQP